MSQQAEINCLSVLMKAPENVYQAIDLGLERRHFIAYPDHGYIFDAIGRAAAESKDTSAHAVYLQLANLDAESKIPVTRIFDIESAIPTSAFLVDTVKTVIGSAQRRQLVTELAAAKEAAANTEARTFDEVWEAVSPHIEASHAISTARPRRDIAHMAETLAHRIEHPETMKIIPSPWPRWDAKATPIKAGEMITIAARPGLGKTALAINLAHCAQRTGKPTILFSLEMSGEELIDRLSRHRGGHPTLGNREKHLTSIRECGQLKNLHIYDNTERHTIATIEARCRLHAGMSAGVGLVVIDYLQLIEPTDRRVPREQQVAEISRRCKQLAGILDCPVIILAQLNRAIEKEDRKPRLSDLRESGAIEQDSDRVWFLWQDPKTIDPSAEEPPAINILLLQEKCRGGPPNVWSQMKFDRPIFTFTSIIPHS